MAQSLSEECTPLKREYDSCFNAWFEGYLEPAVATSPEERSKYSQEKAAEYERNCGKIWTQYRECVQVTIRCSFPSRYGPGLTLVATSFFSLHVLALRRIQKAVKDKGLDVLLEQARAENPLKEPPPAPSVDKISTSS